AVAALAHSGEVDAVMLTGWFGGYSADEPELARTEAAVAADMASAVEHANATFVVQSMFPSSPTLNALREAGVPVYADTRSAAWVLSRLAFRAHPWNLPAAVQRDGQGAGGGYFAARDVLSRAGIQFVQALEV